MGRKVMWVKFQILEREFRLNLLLTLSPIKIGTRLNAQASYQQSIYSKEYVIPGTVLTSELPSARMNEDGKFELQDKLETEKLNAVSVQDFRATKLRSEEFDNLSSYRSKQYHDLDEGKKLIQSSSSKKGRGDLMLSIEQPAAFDPEPNQ
jgi:hypothetical protein